MKIALIHHQYVRKGGMEQYLADLIKGFSEAGDSVYLITSKLDSNAPYLDRCTVIKNSVSLIPKPLRKCFFSGQLAKHITGQGFDLTLSVTRSVSQDIIVCGGTHRGFLRAMEQKPSLPDRLEISLEENSYRYSKRIIAHSKMLRDEIISLYDMPPEKVFVLYPPSDTDRFNLTHRKNRNQFRRQYGLDDKRIALLFPSTGHIRKGLDILVKAMTYFEPGKYEVIIAGSRPKIDHKIEGVKYIGFVENIENLYAAVDLAVLPSRYEPFGLAAIESVLCGTPVVIPRNFGAHDLLTDDESMVIEALTPEATAEAIKKASERDFDISPDFAVQKSLTLKDHIAAIKNIAAEFNS